MPARPFWNSPILAMLFLISSLSTGVAAILLVRSLFGEKNQDDGQAFEQQSYLLSSSDMLLIALEVLVIFLFIMYAHLTIGNVEAALTVIMGGELTTLFWLGFVVLGLLLPAAIELKYVIPTLLYQKAYAIPRTMEFVICALVIVGGFMLRYIVVIAGQITGPVGI
jgi:formate-dependent nitrite reductase membrane component NrfD